MSSTQTVRGRSPKPAPKTEKASETKKIATDSAKKMTTLTKPNEASESNRSRSPRPTVKTRSSHLLPSNERLANRPTVKSKSPARPPGASATPSESAASRPTTHKVPTKKADSVAPKTKDVSAKEKKSTKKPESEKLESKKSKLTESAPLHNETETGKELQSVNLIVENEVSETSIIAVEKSDCPVDESVEENESSKTAEEPSKKMEEKENAAIGITTAPIDKEQNESSKTSKKPSKKDEEKENTGITTPSKDKEKHTESTSHDEKAKTTPKINDSGTNHLNTMPQDVSRSSGRTSPSIVIDPATLKYHHDMFEKTIRYQEEITRNISQHYMTALEKAMDKNHSKVTLATRTKFHRLSRLGGILKDISVAIRDLELWEASTTLPGEVITRIGETASEMEQETKRMKEVWVNMQVALDAAYALKDGKALEKKIAHFHKDLEALVDTLVELNSALQSNKVVRKCGSLPISPDRLANLEIAFPTRYAAYDSA